MVISRMMPGIAAGALALGLSFALTACGSPGGKRSASGSVPYSPPIAASTSSASATAPSTSKGPTDAERFAEAVAQIRAGRTQDAEKALTELVERHPGRAAPLINLGILQARSGRWETARDNLWKAIHMSGISAAHKARAQNELGIVLRHMGNHEAAEQAYRDALASQPGNARAQLNLAILYDLYLKRPADAIEHYRRYQKLLDVSDEALQAQTALWIEQLRKDAAQ